MTLFIDLPLPCREDVRLNSVDTLAKRVYNVEETDQQIVEKETPHHKRSDESPGDDFLSDPHLISLTFPSTSSHPQLSVLISSRNLRSSRTITVVKTGTSFVCASTHVDARVCGALVASCQWKTFRRNFIEALTYDHDRRSRSSRVLLCLSLRWPTFLPLDASFSLRVLRLLHDRLDLEIAMAWLSTLGGGFSALGDYSSGAAEKAQRISLAQMKLARDMGDPIVAAKAWVWFSLSVIQKGDLKTANRIVKRQLYFSRTKTGRTDPRLRNMCKGVLSKIRYLRENEMEELDR